MLNDLRVIEVGQVLSAPYAGMILCDLGAEVVKVEKPGGGDEARNMGSAFRDGASMTFQDVNRGKHSVVIDLKTPEGVVELFALLEDADVLIHNLRPGEAEKLGIDAATVSARFPKLIYCEMSAFGHKGPRRLQPGYEPLLQAFGGLISINGDKDGPPSRMGASLVDQGTAMWAVIGILAAVRQRTGSERGCVINASLLETALGWTASRVHEFVNQGRPAERFGTGHPNLVPYQAFETQDGQLMVCAGNDRLFAKLARALMRPEWLDDPRFSTNRQRLKNREAIVDAVQEILSGGKRATWIALLEAAGVPVAPVNTIAELVREPQVHALDIIRPVADLDFMLTGLPLSFDGIRPAVDRPAPLLGADASRYLRAASDGTTGDKTP